MIRILFFAILLVASTTQARIKNPQQVLGALLTRAGVANMKSLDHSELVELCESGYTEAYFVYPGANDQRVSCSRGTIHYRSVSDYRSPETMNVILEAINSGLQTGSKSFVHCYNGAHASGFVAAVVLRSFCGLSGDQAVNYWDRTLNGYPLEEPNRSRLMARIRAYPVRGELELSEAQKSRFGCP